VSAAFKTAAGFVADALPCCCATQGLSRLTLIANMPASAMRRVASVLFMALA
jgi:hypothetical protein